METNRLTDPVFWESAAAAFPGVATPSWAGDVPGLVWFQTSGTTGMPRWIGLSREALLLSAAVVNRHLGVAPDDVWGLALPPRHVGGFGVVARSFEAGSMLETFNQPWEPRGFAAWLRERRVNHLSLVPTQVHDLVAADLVAPEALRTLVVGGGALGEAEGCAARKLGWPVLASYGMTEAGSQIATMSPESLDQRYRSAPLPVLPHWEVQCRGGGLIAIRGAALFEAEASEVPGGIKVRPRKGKWHLTGDLGVLTDGGLRLSGRADALVKVLGELVDPLAIERRIGVDQAIVVALPDARRQHRLVMALDSAVPDAEAKLARYNATAAGPWRVDGPVRVVAFPKSELGKVRRFELARRLASDGQRAAF